MTPSKRNFTTRGSSTTEAALLTRGASQLYISLGDTTADGAIAVRIYHKPLVLLIWWGPVLMAFGGVLSLSDRRLRVGAPKPAQGAARLAGGGVKSLKRILACLFTVARDDRIAGRATPCSPTKSCPIPPRNRARGICRANCAAWCARTSRSTIPKRRWRAICGCWCASGSRPATATRR